MELIHKSIVLFCATFFCAATLAHAADRFWIGSGGLWNQTANWSATSGGAPGVSAPGTADIAIFDEHSGDCQVNANVNVKGILLAEDFAGTINQTDGYTVTVGASHYTQQAGTFIGGEKAFTLTGGFYLEGGVFTAGDAQELTFPVAFRVNPASFNAGTSRVNIRSSGAAIVVGSEPSGIIDFYRLRLGNVSASTTRTLAVEAGTTLRVADNLELAGSKNLSLSGAEPLLALGNVYLDSRIYSGGTLTIKIAGDGEQWLFGEGGSMTRLAVDKPSGVLHLDGTIVTAAILSFIAGDVEAHDSTVRFEQTVTMSGNVTLANVVLGNRTASTAQTLTFTEGAGLVIAGALSFVSAAAGRNYTLPTGIEARGNISMDGATYPGGPLTINGTGDQLWTGNSGSAPALRIDKPSGVLYLAGATMIDRTLTYLAGEIEPGESTFSFRVPITASLAVKAETPLVLGNVDIGRAAHNQYNQNFNLQDNSEIVVRGCLKLKNPNSKCWITINGGVIHAQGDIRVYANEYADGFKTAGGSLILIDGADDQMFFAETDASQLLLPVQIDKPSGRLILENSWKFRGSAQNMELLSGTLHLQTHEVAISGANAGFTMAEAAALMTTVGEDACGSVKVTGTGAASVAGELFVDVPDDFTPDTEDVWVVVSAASGAVQNTPFQKENATQHYLYTTLYNAGGNHVQITNLRKVFPGSMFKFR